MSRVASTASGRSRNRSRHLGRGLEPALGVLEEVEAHLVDAPAGAKAGEHVGDGAPVRPVHEDRVGRDEGHSGRPGGAHHPLFACVVRRRGQPSAEGEPHLSGEGRPPGGEERGEVRCRPVRRQHDEHHPLRCGEEVAGAERPVPAFPPASASAFVFGPGPGRLGSSAGPRSVLAPSPAPASLGPIRDSGPLPRFRLRFRRFRLRFPLPPPGPFPRSAAGTAARRRPGRTDRRARAGRPRDRASPRRTTSDPPRAPPRGPAPLRRACRGPRPRGPQDRGRRPAGPAPRDGRRPAGRSSSRSPPTPRSGRHSRRSPPGKRPEAGGPGGARRPPSGSSPSARPRPGRTSRPCGGRSAGGAGSPHPRRKPAEGPPDRAQGKSPCRNQRGGPGCRFR